MRMTELVIPAVRRERMTDASRFVTTNGAGGAAARAQGRTHHPVTALVPHGQPRADSRPCV